MDAKVIGSLLLQKFFRDYFFIFFHKVLKNSQNMATFQKCSVFPAFFTKKICILE